MEKKNHNPAKISSISQFHNLLRLPKPLHPMISLVDNTHLVINEDLANNAFLLDFYKISYKFSTNGKMGYGQGYYDFNEGGLLFASPNQLIFTENEEGVEYGGFTLLFHTDFIRNYPLGKKIKAFGFFSYSVNEALFLSEKEKQIIFSIFENIKEELNSRIDDFSQDVVVSHIEVLLNYSNRFYKRQFITRKTISHDLLLKVEETLENYISNAETLKKGLPTVEFLASQINVSSHYLSDMLRNLTGQNAQQHIHSKLIEKSKDFLITTNLSVAEIAYHLGFEYPQSFSKLFKKKTSLTPLEFKNSLN